jgi:hypothetical protein
MPRNWSSSAASMLGLPQSPLTHALAHNTNFSNCSRRLTAYLIWWRFWYWHCLHCQVIAPMHHLHQPAETQNSLHFCHKLRENYSDGSEVKINNEHRIWSMSANVSKVKSRAGKKTPIKRYYCPHNSSSQGNSTFLWEIFALLWNIGELVWIFYVTWYSIHQSNDRNIFMCYINQYSVYRSHKYA